MLPIISHSQAYIRFSGGYGFSASKDNFSTPVTVLESSIPTNPTIISKENIYGTIGSGATVRIAGGYTFSNNFGIDLDCYYLIGDKKYATENTNNTSGINEISFAYTRQFRITPSLYVRASKGFIKPYAGLGPVLPLAGFTYLEVKRTNPTINENSFYIRKISGNFTVGFESYLGISSNWPNENFNIFAELRFTGLRIKSKFSETVQYDITNTISGEVTDKLPDLNTFQREINFVDKLTNELNTFEGPGGINSVTPDFDRPMDRLTSTTNFNSLSLNIGVRVNLIKNYTTE